MVTLNIKLQQFEFLIQYQPENNQKQPEIYKTDQSIIRAFDKLPSSKTGKEKRLLHTKLSNLCLKQAK